MVAHVPDSIAQDLAGLCRALDLQTELLEAAVEASRRQVQAIIGFRASSRERVAELGAVQSDIATLTNQIGDAAQEVRDGIAAIARRVGLAPDVRLRTLLLALTPQERSAVNDRASTVRSLAQSLGELQSLSHFHAQRGLQIVANWRALATRSDGDGPAYTTGGRVRPTTMHVAVSLDCDL